MPADVSASITLMLHVGRELLGFRTQPDRKEYLPKPKPARTPEEIITAYDRFLNQATGNDPVLRNKLLVECGLISKHLPNYAEALSASRGGTKVAHFAATYERLLAAALRTEPALRAKVFDSFGPLGSNFDGYIDSLVDLQRSSEIATVIGYFEPYWKHNLGYGKLGKAAFRAREFELAERFFLSLRDSYKNWYRSEEMDHLAEIWHQRGAAADAQALLVECLRQILGESRDAHGTDKNLVEGWFQEHRSTFLRLFPEMGEAELTRLGIPPTSRG
jgi:hypothetical protein